MKIACELRNNYNLTLVRTLAGVRWDMPISMLFSIDQIEMNKIQQEAMYFNKEWTKYKLISGDENQMDCSSLIKAFP